MREIGVRELKVNASEIVRNVRKRRTRYLITYRGRPVGILAPLGSAEPVPPDSAEDVTAAWDELTRLGQEIARGWPSGKTSEAAHRPKLPDTARGGFILQQQCQRLPPL